VYGVNTQWLVVDRVVAEKVAVPDYMPCSGPFGAGSATPVTPRPETSHYLVKWCELGYDMCT
jgi:hypothetical protein